MSGKGRELSLTTQLSTAAKSGRVVVQADCIEWPRRVQFDVAELRSCCPHPPVVLLRSVCPWAYSETVQSAS